MKKYNIIVLFIFLCFLLGFYKVDAIFNDAPLFGKVIYVDPGHGGADPGAIYGGIYEKDINLEISFKIVDKLREKGAISYSLREGDYDLAMPNIKDRKRSDFNERIRVMEKNKADLYVSIHLNAVTSTQWRGAQVFYSSRYKENKILAEVMQQHFKEKLGSKRKIKSTNLYLYRNVAVPGVLAEVGFLSNGNERYNLRKSYYQEKIATTIVESIVEFYKKN